MTVKGGVLILLMLGQQTWAEQAQESMLSFSGAIPKDLRSSPPMQRPGPLKLTLDISFLYNLTPPSLFTQGSFFWTTIFSSIPEQVSKTTVSGTFNDSLFLQSFQRRSSGDELLQSALHTVLVTCIRSTVMQSEHWGFKTNQSFVLFCLGGGTFLFMIANLYKNKWETEVAGWLLGWLPGSCCLGRAKE